MKLIKIKICFIHNKDIKILQKSLFPSFSKKEEMPFLANDDVATCGARCGRSSGSFPSGSLLFEALLPSKDDCKIHAKKRHLKIKWWCSVEAYPSPSRPFDRHHAELINRTEGPSVPSVPMLLDKINVTRKY